MIDQLKNKIRYGMEPNNPALLSIWLAFEEDRCQKVTAEEQWNNYIGIVQFLLETFADTMNPDHWRVTCLDHIARPLCSLNRIVKRPQQQSELQELLSEINVISHYFSPSFIK
ncbi:hypothetical protein [Marinomonas sp. PE14-40]|uniref:hypothetical protein n=1 Tax=Marinomonas sp. PE14-40 TaxID=3060621 RepID=UPI003F67BF1C